jgi:RecA/RadA recombinase
MMPKIEKLRTEIEGFDLISNGGLPKGRATLLSGTAGSAKTVFATQFLAAGVEKAGEPGVFVTFEESPADIRRNVHGFGWDIAAWEAAGRWAFVDASPQLDEPLVVSGGLRPGRPAGPDRARRAQGRRPAHRDRLHRRHLPCNWATARRSATSCSGSGRP